VGAQTSDSRLHKYRYLYFYTFIQITHSNILVDDALLPKHNLLLGIVFPPISADTHTHVSQVCERPRADPNSRDQVVITGGLQEKGRALARLAGGCGAVLTA